MASGKMHFLTSLSFGVYSPRRSPYRSLLCDHEHKRFVIIVLRDEPQQADGRLGKAFRHAVNRFWDKKNPFSWGEESPAQRVVALEVEWSTIMGVDYRCPLHEDGKLVLEARHMVKRCFKTVEDARDFYSPCISELRAGQQLRSFHSAAPTPNKLSLDERQAMLASMSCARLGRRTQLPVSPRFVRPVSRGPSAGSLRPGLTTAEMRVAAACMSEGASGTVGGDWRVVGRGSTHGYGLRAGVEAGPRSVSAARVPRTEATAAHVGRVARARGLASSMPTSRFMDYASADEGDGSSRHRRPAIVAAPTGPMVGSYGAAVPVNGVPGARRKAARRRLQLHAAEGLAAAGHGEAAASGSGDSGSLEVSAKACAWLARHKHLDASPRKAKSVNDLAGMEAAQGPQRRPTDAPAAAAGGVGRLGPHVAEGSVSVCSACRSFSAVNRIDAGCAASWDCGNLWGGAAEGFSERGRGLSGGCTSGSVNSLQGPFMSQQHQQGLAKELQTLSRRRRGRQVRGEDPGRVQQSEADREGGGGGAGGLAGGGEGAGGWVPRASRWTQPSATFSSNTLVLKFRDPLLPQELRRFVKSDMRLLKLYESGLPAWAVFMPSYGLPYRPWLRRALWLLFIAISIFSMGCGFYDLYKNVPFLKQVITAVASRMYLPASELFEWLERHTQIRMSILLTYLFSKSPLLVSLMRMLRSLVALLQQLLAPAAAAASAALQPPLAALQAAASGVGVGVAAAGAAVWRATQPVVASAVGSGREVAAVAAAVLGPPARALWAVAVLLAQLVRLMAALVGMVLVGPLQLVCSIGGALSWAGAEVAEKLAAAADATASAMRWAVTLGRAARRAAPAVKAGARLAAQAAGGTASIAGGGGGLSGGMAVWQWLGLEVVGAYNAVRLTFLQAFKSAQAVMNFCVTVANTAVQHRVSLLLQLRRFITRQKERLPPSVAASVPLPAFVSSPSFASIPAFDIPLPGPNPDEDLLEPETELASGLAAMPSTHSLYNMDMVLLGTSEDDSDAMAPERAFGSDCNGILKKDGSGSSSTDLTEPISIPLGGGRASGGGGEGLRCRRIHGAAAAGRLGCAARGDRSAPYGMYKVPRQRLDAVDEEELEDAQQHSEGDSFGGGERSNGCGASEGGRERLASSRHGGCRGSGLASCGARQLGRIPWNNGHVGGLDLLVDDAEDEAYLAYASAPGYWGPGHLEVFQGRNGQRPSQVVSSLLHGGIPEPMCLSRSVPIGAQLRGQEASGIHNKQQRQQRRSKRSQGRGVLPPMGAAAAATEARYDVGRCELGRRAARAASAASFSLHPAAMAGPVALFASEFISNPPTALRSGAAPGAQRVSEGSLGYSSPVTAAAGSASGVIAAAGSGGVPGSAVAAAAGAGVGAIGPGASGGGKAAEAGRGSGRSKGRGDGGGDANKKCGKRPSVGAKHVSRQQQAIHAA